MDMEISRPVAEIASATWWVRWRPRLATFKRVSATARRASVDCRAISAWKTITTSPLMAVKVTQFFFFEFIYNFSRPPIRSYHHPKCLTKWKKETWLKLNKRQFRSSVKMCQQEEENKKKLRVKVEIFKFWESQWRHLMWPREGHTARRKSIKL